MHVSGRDLYQALANVTFRSEPTTDRRASKPAESPASPTAPDTAVADAPEAKLEDAAFALKYQRSEKASLKLRTQEGDVIRIRMQSRSTMNATLSASDDGADGFDEMELMSKSATRLRITVKGHLNADEMAAVRDALGQARDVADSFFARDLQGAFDIASAISLDSDQIAGMKMKLRLRETAMYSGLGQLGMRQPEQVGSGDGAPNAEGADTPDAPLQVRTSPVEIAPPSSPTVEDAPPAAGAAPDAGPADGPDGAVAPEANEAGGAATTTGAGDAYAMAEALRAIGDFMAQLFETIGGGQDRPADRLDVSLKLRFVKMTIETLAEAREESEGPIPALVGDTLDALAAAEGPGVDKVA